MKKKVLVSLVSIMSVALAAVGVSRLIQYYTSLPEADPVYERVEAQRYEFVIPNLINEMPADYLLIVSTIGERTAYKGFNVFPLVDIISFRLSWNDEDFTSSVTLVDDNFGRYVISETQVADEPVSFTIEPFYYYVLF